MLRLCSEAVNNVRVVAFSHYADVEIEGGSGELFESVNNCVSMNTREPFALVVDDDPLILMDASDIVEKAGFRPLEATDVIAAIKVLEEYDSEVRVLFTDVQMPGHRDGFSLAREAARRWSNIWIVVASGQARPGPDDLPVGARFITKPFSAQVVHDHLREMLPDEHQPAPLRR